MGQINFGLSQGRSSINAVASFSSSSLHTSFSTPLCSPIPRSIEQHLAREKSYLAIIVIYVFITDQYFDATRLHCFQLLARNIFASSMPRFVSNFRGVFRQRALLRDIPVVGHSPNSYRAMRFAISTSRSLFEFEFFIIFQLLIEQRPP